MARYHTQFAAAGPRRLPRRLGHLERLESRALLAGLTCLGDYVLLQDECAAHRGPFELVGGSSHCPDQAELVPPAVPASRQLGTQPDALPADISPNTEPGTVSEGPNGVVRGERQSCTPENGRDEENEEDPVTVGSESEDRDGQFTSEADSTLSPSPGRPQAAPPATDANSAETDDSGSRTAAPTLALLSKTAEPVKLLQPAQPAVAMAPAATDQFFHYFHSNQPRPDKLATALANESVTVPGMQDSFMALALIMPASGEEDASEDGFAADAGRRKTGQSGAAATVPAPSVLLGRPTAEPQPAATLPSATELARAEQLAHSIDTALEQLLAENAGDAHPVASPADPAVARDHSTAETTLACCSPQARTEARDGATQTLRLGVFALTSLLFTSRCTPLTASLRRLPNVKLPGVKLPGVKLRGGVQDLLHIRLHRRTR